MVYTRNGPRNTGRKGSYDHNNHWCDDIVVIEDELRVMPMTIPHEEVALHWISCTCKGCAAYPVDVLRRLKRENLQKIQKQQRSRSSRSAQR